MSSDGRYGYCKIFVKYDESSAVLARLAAGFGVEPERRSLTLPGLVLDVRPNPDRDPAAGDDFVRWPVTVEAEVDDPDSPAVVVPTVSAARRVPTPGCEAALAKANEEFDAVHSRARIQE